MSENGPNLPQSVTAPAAEAPVFGPQPAPAAEAHGSIPPALTAALNSSEPAIPAADSTAPSGESLAQTAPVDTSPGAELSTEPVARVEVVEVRGNRGEVGRTARASAITRGGQLEREYNQKKAKWEKEGSKKKDKPVFSADRADGAAFFCKKLQTLGDAAEPVIGAAELQPESDTALRVALVGDRWVAVPNGADGAVAITEIRATKSADGKTTTYSCMVNGLDDAQTIELSTLQDAQLLAEAKAISDSLSGAQKTIFDAHIAQLTDPSAPLAAEASEKTILEAARASGLISAESVRKYVEKAMAPAEGETGDSATELAQRRKDLLARLDGKLTVTSDDLAAVLGETMPIGNAETQTKITILEQRLQAAKNAFMATSTSPNPDTGAIQKLSMEISSMESELAVYQKLQSLGDIDGVTSSFYAGVENGTIPIDVVNAFEDSLASGNPQQILESMLNSMYKDDEEGKEEAKKKVDMRLLAGLGGIGGLIMVLMLFGKKEQG